MNMIALVVRNFDLELEWMLWWLLRDINGWMDKPTNIWKLGLYIMPTSNCIVGLG